MVISKILVVAIDLYVNTDSKRVMYIDSWWRSGFLSFIAVSKEQNQLGWKRF